MKMDLMFHHVSYEQFSSLFVFFIIISSYLINRIDALLYSYVL